MLWSLLNTLVAALRAFFVGRTQLALEILALRQQVAVLKRKRPRPALNPMDRLFWTALRRFWSGWAEARPIVKPETVAGWHRAGLRLYWRWRSRGPAGGRAKTPLEVQELLQQMARENPTPILPSSIAAFMGQSASSKCSDFRRRTRINTPGHRRRVTISA
jgi:putative transposase